MSKLVRSFIALYPDPAARTHITDFLRELRTRDRSVRWEHPDKVHITLKFLGDVEAAVLDAITADLKARIADQSTFSARIDRTGAFPNLRRARIVWLGFAGEEQQILQLQRGTEEVCAAHGLEPEQKKFTPHFTIGRVRRNADIGSLENDIAACSFQPVPVQFTAVRIMESTLTPQGAIHKERARIEFTPGE
ncbi:MAG: RNA 2',3'-cyclic phosphodiesterase [Ignavibacteria bacterium]|nr:MAG: RNA 2',3'-cyclic phosphodiesterase [Ignavibacteria bacterium]